MFVFYAANVAVCCEFSGKTRMDFDRVIQSVLNSKGQGSFTIKQKQREVLEKIVLYGKDSVIVLPTGYGKSLIQQMLPPLFPSEGMD